jgi:hypothetical protein
VSLEIVQRVSMPSARRFPPGLELEENNDACFIVRDANGQALCYFYFEYISKSWPRTVLMTKSTSSSSAARR